MIFENIKNFFKKLKSHLTSTVALIVVVVLCAASLMFQYFSREDAVSPLTLVGAVIVPFQEGVNEIGRFLFTSEQDKLTLDEARKQIQALENENSALRRKNDELNSLALENKELRALLGAKDKLADYEMTHASIIGASGVNAFRRFTINKGSADGMKVNMNVITNAGLVGIITSVGLNYSVVSSIIEDGMNVSVMTKDNHSNCIVTGDVSLKSGSMLRLDGALVHIDFDADGTLVTSYISDKYLPGLLVGYVTEMKPNDDTLTQSGFVRTAVDFSSIKEVLVITTLRESLEEVSQ